MKRRQFTPEKVIGLLLQTEVELAQGKRVGRGLPRPWYLGELLSLAQRIWRPEARSAPRMKDLEKENGRLKKAVAELTLDKQILKEALEGNF